MPRRIIAGRPRFLKPHSVKLRNTGMIEITSTGRSSTIESNGAHGRATAKRALSADEMLSGLRQLASVVSMMRLESIASIARGVPMRKSQSPARIVHAAGVLSWRGIGMRRHLPKPESAGSGGGRRNGTLDGTGGKKEGSATCALSAPAATASTTGIMHRRMKAPGWWGTPARDRVTGLVPSAFYSVLLVVDQLEHHVSDLLLELALRGARREVTVRAIRRVSQRLDPGEDLRTAARIGLHVTQEIHVDVPRLGVRGSHLVSAIQHVLHRHSRNAAPNLDLVVPDRALDLHRRDGNLEHRVDARQDLICGVRRHGNGRGDRRIRVGRPDVHRAPDRAAHHEARGGWRHGRLGSSGLRAGTGCPEHEKQHGRPMVTHGWHSDGGDYFWYAARLRRFQIVTQGRVRSNVTYGSFVCMPIRLGTPRSIGRPAAHPR